MATTYEFTPSQLREALAEAADGNPFPIPGTYASQEEAF